MIRRKPQAIFKMWAVFVTVVLFHTFEQNCINGAEIDGTGVDQNRARMIREINTLPKIDYTTNDKNVIVKREKRQLFIVPSKMNIQNSSLPKYNYKNGSNIALKYNYNNRYYKNNNRKHDLNVEQNPGTLKRNEKLLSNNDYNSWRANYTWNTVLKATRQEYSNYNNGNQRIYDLNDTRSNVESQANISQSNSVNEIKTNFRPRNTYMPKFRHANVHADNTAKNTNTSTDNNAIFTTSGNGTYANSITNYNITDQPYAPGYLPRPEFNGVQQSGRRHFYNNFGRRRPGKNITVEPSEVTFSGCLLCKNDCPVNHHKVLLRCVPDYDDYYSEQ